MKLEKIYSYKLHGKPVVGEMMRFNDRLYTLEAHDSYCAAGGRRPILHIWSGRCRYCDKKFNFKTDCMSFVPVDVCEEHSLEVWKLS